MMGDCKNCQMISGETCMFHTDPDGCVEYTPECVYELDELPGTYATVCFYGYSAVDGGIKALREPAATSVITTVYEDWP